MKKESAFSWQFCCVNKKTQQHMADVTGTIRKRYLTLLGNTQPFFINKGYTIEQFAADLGTNRSYASRFVNKELGVTFSTLLNKLRLAHFIRQKSERPDATIGQLAKECGFNNAFSFRRAFRQEYGTTPSEYFK